MERDGEDGLTYHPPIKLGFPECDSYFTPVPQVDRT